MYPEYPAVLLPSIEVLEIVIKIDYTGNVQCLDCLCIPLVDVDGFVASQHL